MPATTLLLLFGSTRTLPTALYCGNCPGGLGVSHAEHIRPQHRPGGTGIGGFQNALTAHRKGTKIQVARAGIDGVMIVRIDDIVSIAVVEISGSSVTTVQVVEALQQLVVFQTPPPTVPAYATMLPFGRSRIDSDIVNSPFGGRVIKAARAAGHAQWLRTERGKIGRTKRVWIGEVKLQMLSCWDAGGHARMLRCGGSQPCRIKTAGRKRQTIVPVLFQFCKTISFVLVSATRHRHIASRLRDTAQRAIFAANIASASPENRESIRAAPED